MKTFVLLFALTFSLNAFAQSEITLCDTSMSPKTQDALKNALAHIDSFEYIRGTLKKYANDGDTYCASGVMLTKNIYQYYKFFWNIEVRDQQDQLVTVLPLYFQSASIQAHHNAGHKPWIVLPRTEVGESLYTAAQNLLGADSLSVNVSHFSLSSLYDAVKASPSASEIDFDTFSIANLESSDGLQYYLGTWVYSVNTGSLYTQEFSSKVIAFQWDPATNTLTMSPATSAFDMLTKYFEDTLVKTAQFVPADAKTWVDYTLELIK